MKITLELLVEEGACADQRALFADTFPDGATVTLANVRKAEKAGLRVWWLRRFLDDAAVEAYNGAHALEEVCGEGCRRALVAGFKKGRVNA